jgi:hypothetical protein
MPDANQLALLINHSTIEIFHCNVILTKKVEEPSDALFDRGIDGSDAWSILEFWFSADTGLGFS